MGKISLIRLGLAWLTLSTLCVYAQEPTQKLIPDPDTYGDFLVSEYDAAKPSLVAFKDPRCPYCVNALKRLYQLSNYNVYLFWSPILGDRSQRDVNVFFYCDSPASPQVIEAVTERRSPDCDGQFNSDLAKRNDAFVAQYNPTSVPQYWFGGQRVGIGQLKLSMSTAQQVALLAESSTVQIPWHRYPSAVIRTPFQDRYNIGIVLNHSLGDDLQRVLLNETQFNWYVFDKQQPLSSQEAEFRVLTGTLDHQAPIVLLEGKPLSGKERKRVLPAAVLKLLSDTTVTQHHAATTG
ncbi:thioredoxin fold domain-containing protein [Alteromonas halophila]|uniref:Thioredoxin-like fold domain-containing protein n=1 Tax=Alteromonas halophila TaxID=516698 RepID=A0A918JQ99_9ALTE|nr:thioredoxin fold domain-containing protein [Alteromonas halophila]GGW96898.1 hypothetical protein GCM10007391_33730 [Alteromonas halophila]